MEEKMYFTIFALISLFLFTDLYYKQVRIGRNKEKEKIEKNKIILKGKKKEIKRAKKEQI